MIAKFESEAFSHNMHINESLYFQFIALYGKFIDINKMYMLYAFVQPQHLSVSSQSKESSPL